MIILQTFNLTIGTYRDEGAESFNSHSSWPGQQGGRRLRAGGSTRSYRFFGYRFLGCRRYSVAPNISGRRRLSPGSTPISRDDPPCRSGGDMATAPPICRQKLINILLPSYAANHDEIIIVKSSLRIIVNTCDRFAFHGYVACTLSFTIINFGNRFEIDFLGNILDI